MDEFYVIIRAFLRSLNLMYCLTKAMNYLGRDPYNSAAGVVINDYDVEDAKRVYEVLFKTIYKEPGLLSLQFIVISGLYDILYHNDSSDVLL